MSSKRKVAVVSVSVITLCVTLIVICHLVVSINQNSSLKQYFGYVNSDSFINSIVAEKF